MASALNTGSVTSTPTGHQIGTTTIGAVGGSALAGAIAIILVWAVGLLGVEIPTEVHSALVIIIGAVGALIGGKLTPTNKAVETTHVVVAPTDNVTPTLDEVESL